MKAAAPLKLREAGQSLWLDNITRNLLTTGTLKRYIDELSITGLTSNPTIFDHAITKSQAYDTASTIAEAKQLHARAARPNLFIKIPGTREGLPAIEEAIFAGVPINVT